MTTRYDGYGLRNATVNSGAEDPGEVDDGFLSYGETDTPPDEGDNVVKMGPTDLLAGVPESARSSARPAGKATKASKASKTSTK